MKYIYLACLITLLSTCLQAQEVMISGQVLDSSKRFILPSVKVMSTAGAITYTDSNGNYNILVTRKDSINFTYREKATRWFPVSDIKYGYPFDIALQVSMGDKYKMLKEVIVIKKSYRQDSLEFRNKYARTFNASRGGLRLSESNALYGGTPGLDPNEIINMFRFRRNRSLKSLQNRLMQEEADKFINYRFNKTLVKKITGLQDGKDLETFMKVWRPDYDLAANTTELEFHTYILEAYRSWKQGIFPMYGQ